eukprot:gene7219-5072_t
MDAAQDVEGETHYLNHPYKRNHQNEIKQIKKMLQEVSEATKNVIRQDTSMRRSVSRAVQETQEILIVKNTWVLTPGTNDNRKTSYL